MKKVDFAYVGAWYGGAVAIAVAMFAAAMAFNIMLLFIASFIFLVFALVFIPGILEKKMNASALALEETFAQNGFAYQHKFSSNSGVFYIDLSGRLAVVWKGNPKALYFADLANITNIHTHDGKQLKGTSLVSCRFQLEGKKYKIYTLRVSNGQYSMKSPEVLEAISKADKLCEMLHIAKQNALNAAAQR